MSDHIDSPDAVVAVPLTQYGEPAGFAQVDREDFFALTELGFRSPWFLERGGGRVLAKPLVGKVAPVDLLIMKPRQAEKVIYLDGNHTNLTRANLTFGHRPTIDIMLERQRKGRKQPRGPAPPHPQRC